MNRTWFLSGTSSNINIDLGKDLVPNKLPVVHCTNKANQFSLVITGDRMGSISEKNTSTHGCLILWYIPSCPAVICAIYVGVFHTLIYWIHSIDAFNHNRSHQYALWQDAPIKVTPDTMFLWLSGDRNWYVMISRSINIDNHLEP